MLAASDQMTLLDIPIGPEAGVADAAAFMINKARGNIAPPSPCYKVGPRSSREQRCLSEW